MNHDLEMDLRNLISCLHYHEEDTEEGGEVVQQTLNTITQICLNESCGKDAFREADGLDDLTELLLNTQNTIYMEHVLKTLALVIDENIHSKMYLTQKKVFGALQLILRKKSFSKTIHKNALLLLSTILYQNSAAQTLLSQTELIQDILNIYQSSAHSYLASNTSQDSTDVWINATSVLCFAVNNPQNEKNQRSCAGVFPVSLRVLESSLHSEILCSIATFLSLSIANNGDNQRAFGASDGLLVMKRCLNNDYRALVCDVEECNNVIGRDRLQAIHRTIAIISSAVLDHEKNSRLVCKLGLLPLMTKLLLIDVLDVQLKTKIVLAIGHCIDACDDSRRFLVQQNDLDVVLRRNLLVGDAELSCACKYLMQLCLKDLKKANKVHSLFNTPIEEDALPQNPSCFKKSQIDFSQQAKQLEEDLRKSREKNVSDRSESSSGSFKQFIFKSPPPPKNTRQLTMQRNKLSTSTKIKAAKKLWDGEGSALNSAINKNTTLGQQVNAAYAGRNYAAPKEKTLDGCDLPLHALVSSALPNKQTSHKSTSFSLCSIVSDSHDFNLSPIRKYIHPQKSAREKKPENETLHNVLISKYALYTPRIAKKAGLVDATNFASDTRLKFRTNSTSKGSFSPPKHKLQLFKRPSSSKNMLVKNPPEDRRGSSGSDFHSIKSGDCLKEGGNRYLKRTPLEMIPDVLEAFPKCPLSNTTSLGSSSKMRGHSHTPSIQKMQREESASCMPVFVLHSKKCADHGLITAQETLEVVPLIDVEKISSKR